jgi:hypothetical protein
LKEWIEDDPMKAPGILLLVVALLAAGMASAWAGGQVYGGVRIGVGGGPGPYWGGGGYYGRPCGGYYGRPCGGYYGRAYFPGPYLYPDPFFAPYYAPQPVVVMPSAPPVYIEQNNAAVEQAQEATQYWYFCRGANNYYPYVKECPGGWQKVLPQPAQ